MKLLRLLCPLLLTVSAAATAAERKAPSEVCIMPGPEWREFTHRIDVRPDSALDLSFLNHVPAGKFGRVVVRNGQFQFERRPGVQARFYGTNLNFSANYPSHAEAEKLAERLAACGFNALRVHHYDRGLVDPAAADSLTVVPEQRDRLDYLFFCLKKRGIYVTTDIFVSRSLRDAELGGAGHDGRDVKIRTALSASVAANLMEFARRLLTHVNPYTGTSWKDDPALISLSFVNENNLAYIWDKRPGEKALFEQAFRVWRQEHPDRPGDGKDAAFNRFVSGLQTHNYLQFKEFVTGKLGASLPCTDCNFVSNVIQSIARDRFDYVDNHCYWDHPKKESSGLVRHHQKSVLKEFCSVPGSTLPSRLFGKPFTVSEFNFVCPNVYRAEGNPVVGALAALQGWDAIYRFAFARALENATSIQPASRFDAASDPINLLGERIIALLFRRGDVRPAPFSAPYLVTPDCLAVYGRMERYSPLYNRLGLICRIGTAVGHDGRFALPADAKFAVTKEAVTAAAVAPVPLYRSDDGLLQKLLEDGRISRTNYDPRTERTLSATGEIACDTKAGTFTVTTPRSECLVLPAGRSGRAGIMAVRDNTAFAAVFASALDGLELERSRRILLLHLTDVKNTGNTFRDPKLKLLADDGRLPHLVRRGSARIALRRKDAAGLTVWALSMSGERREKIAVESTGGTLSFRADTAGVSGGCLAYEIVTGTERGDRVSTDRR